MIAPCAGAEQDDDGILRDSVLNRPGNGDGFGVGFSLDHDGIRVKARLGVQKFGRSLLSGIS